MRALCCCLTLKSCLCPLCRPEHHCKGEEARLHLPALRPLPARQLIQLIQTGAPSCQVSGLLLPLAAAAPCSKPAVEVEAADTQGSADVCGAACPVPVLVPMSVLVLRLSES